MHSTSGPVLFVCVFLIAAFSLKIAVRFENIVRKYPFDCVLLKVSFCFFPFVCCILFFPNSLSTRSLFTVFQ